MPAATLNDVVTQLLGVLREAFEGPAERWSYFTDQGPEAGLFGTLAKVGAAEASRTVAGTSIAAHAHHAAFSLEASTAWINGDRSPRDWKSSWNVSSVDEESWRALRERLAAGYRMLRSAIEAHAMNGESELGESIGVAAHMAYHLGAVRQKTAFVART
ncbi:MAG: hypothetical protein ABSF77_07855 [Spirochaetia bacterium]|jgi:hypothetical protein